MKALGSALARYLSELGIAGVTLKTMDGVQGKLPVFLSKSYDFRGAHLFGKDFVLLLRRGKSNPTPAEALKHADMVRSRLGQAVIFVMADLKSFDRRRWVENGLPFIVPRKHFYCPMHLVEFRESARRQVRSTDEVRKSLSASAQALLLAHLQHNPPCSNLADWADYLHYTRMTVSRARRELEAQQLCAVHRAGKSVTLDFTRDRRSLWEQALPVLRSPVLSRREIEILDPSDMNLMRAGISALSDLSMLADDPVPTYAMSSAAYKSIFEAGKIVETAGGDGKCAVIEKWHYAPAVLARNGDTVDRLSLYLSLRDSPDERVQGQLRAMMEEMPW
jgi:DNA-binding MarR family transcriptional regulator